MSQPPGFIHPQYLHHVCQLVKALYSDMHLGPGLQGLVYSYLPTTSFKVEPTITSSLSNVVLIP